MGAKAQFPVYRLCRMLGVSQSGYFAWRGRLACRRQRDDMVLLAHVRSAFALSNGTYGSPRMTRGLAGYRPHGRSPPDRSTDARQRPAGTAEAAVQTNHRQPSRLAGRAQPARSGLHRNGARQEVGRRHLPMSGPAKVGCTSPLSLTCSHAGSSVGRPAIGCIATWPSPLCAKPWPCAVRQQG